MNKKKVIIFGGIGLVLLLALGGGGFFAYKTFFAKPADAAEGAAEGHGKEPAKAEKAAEGHGKEAAKEEKKGGEHGSSEGGASAEESGPPMHTMNFVVNLADPGKPRYLRVNIGLELTASAVDSELKANKSKARDAMVTLLSSKHTTELTSVADKEKLKNEILHRLNSFLTSGKIIEVYFEDFMIQ